MDDRSLAAGHISRREDAFSGRATRIPVGLRVGRAGWVGPIDHGAGFGSGLSRRRTDLELDAFLARHVYVVAFGSDAAGLARRDYHDFVGAQAEGRPGHVDGSEAIAAHDHLAGEAERVTAPGFAQHFEPVEGLSLGVRAGTCRPSAHADHHRVEAGVEQHLRIDLSAELGTAHEADPRLPKRPQLFVEDLFRQLELRDEVTERASCLLAQVIESDLMAPLDEEPRGSQAGGARAGHRDPPAARDSPGAKRVPGASDALVVGGRAMQRANGDGFVRLRPAADRLTVARADAPEDAGEGHFFADYRRGAGGVAGGQGGHVSGDIDVCGAGVRAGCLAVRIVVGEVHLEIALAASEHMRRVRLHCHAVGDPSGARGLELVDPFHLHQAEAAARPGRGT